MIKAWLRHLARKAYERKDIFNAMRWAQLYGSVELFGVFGTAYLTFLHAVMIYQAMQGRVKIKDPKLQAVIDQMRNLAPKR